MTCSGIRAVFSPRARRLLLPPAVSVNRVEGQVIVGKYRAVAPQQPDGYLGHFPSRRAANRRSGRAGSEDNLAALDAGADDYVTKPFAMAELLARVRAVTVPGESLAPIPVRRVTL
jgi:hypothetical protein